MCARDTRCVLPDGHLLMCKTAAGLRLGYVHLERELPKKKKPLKEFQVGITEARPQV